MKNKKGWIIGGLVGFGVLVIAIVAIVVNWGVGNNATNLGKQKQQELNAQYLNNQNFLSDCILKVNGVANVAITNADKTNEILTNAMKGRYDGDTSAQPGSGALFSAISEAYPNLQDVNGQFEKVSTVLVGCRTDYRDQQTLLLSKLENFDKWRKGSRIARSKAGKFPDEDLIARVGKKKYTGEEALDKMYEIVLVEDTIDAYETGTIPPGSANPFGPTTTTEGN
jgi:hypothetical protein